MSRLSELAPVPRRAVGMSRAMLALYAGALTAGTHWPRLQLGDPEHPVDKLLHFIAFGGLAFFLSRGRYFRSTWSLLAFTVAWIVADEFTQALPGLGRSFSFEDILAGAMGASTTCILLWATRPLASPIARLRRQRFDAIVDLVLSEPTRFLTMLVSGALGVMVAMPISILISGAREASSPFQAAITGTLFGGVVGAGAFVIHATRRMDERMTAARMCVGCGAEGGDDRARCNRCGTTPLLAQWIPAPDLPARAILRTCLPPVLGGVGTLLATVIGLSLFASVFGAADPVLRLNVWLRGPARGMEDDISILFVATVVGLTVERCRQRIALLLESGSMICLGCGHDLRATAAPSGVGRCGECGAGFVRLAAENP